MAALASLRLRSRRLLSSESDGSPFSRMPSRPRSGSSNVTLELFRCVRFLVEAEAALISLPSTGVIGVRPLLESPVELAGLLPRKPRPYPVPANGLGGEDAYAARDAVRDRVFEGFSVTGEC